LDGIPEFWIVPSNIVSKVIKESHLIWMKGTAKNGTPHKENPLRKFYIIPKYDFLDNF